MSSAPVVVHRGLVAPAATVWGFVRHELLFLSFALMEISLLTPMVLVVLGWARYWSAGLVLLWLLLLMLLPLNLARLMSLLHVSLRRQQRVQMVALLLAVVFSWRQLLYAPAGLLDFSWLRQFVANLADSESLVWARDLSIFVVTLLVWWRGVRLAVRQPEINNLGLRLRLGGLIFAPLLVWFSGRFLNTSIVPFLLLFFLAALTAVALVRAENIEQDQRGTAATLNARWFSVVAGAAAAIVLAGGAIAAFLSGNSLVAVLSWLSPLWRALQLGAVVVGAVLFQIALPFLELLAGLTEALGRVLVAIMGQVAAGLQRLGFLTENEAALTPTPTPEATGPLGVLAGKGLTVFIMLAAIVVIGLALARVYQRSVLAARASAPSRAVAAGDDAPGLAERLLERLGLLRGWRAAASIRRIYRLMCRAAGAAGYPRLEVETPYEYLPTLSRVWPDHLPEARLITESFIRVRYGEVPESPEELEQIRAAWRRLEATEPRRRDSAPKAPATLAKRE